MTVRGKVISLFGAFHLGLACMSIYAPLRFGSWYPLIFPIFFLYGFPVLCFRVHNYFCPLKEGLSRLDEPSYSSWWGGHQIQSLYNAIPWIESILRIVPGAYSVWLRMWGSRVGRGVVWTAQIEITDRSMLEVGHNVIFGHKAGCYAHVIDIRRSGIVLYVKRITIGNGVFIGAGSRLGPGVVIEDGAILPVLTDVSVNQRVRKAA